MHWKEWAEGQALGLLASALLHETAHWYRHRRQRRPNLPPTMFPLTQRSVSGYKFGQRAWYSLPGQAHIGTDYKAAEGTPVYAPFDGTVTNEGYGHDGGNTIAYRPDGADVTMRFMHLSRFLVPKGRVSRGQQIALTGRTGALVDGAHLHLDISNGPVVLGRPFPSNFIDPEKYPWDPYGIDQPVNTAPQGQTSAISIPVVGHFSRPLKLSVAVPQGANVRSSSDTKHDPVTALPYRAPFEALGFLHDEVVDAGLPTENDKWYALGNSEFIWAGATSVPHPDPNY